MKKVSVMVAPAHREHWLNYTLDLLCAHMGADWSYLDPGAAVDAHTACLGYGAGYGQAGVVHLPRRYVAAPVAMTRHELDCGPAGTQAVPVYAESVAPDKGCDLLFNVFAYATCLEEHHHEQHHGPIHSYALKLHGDGERFERPWCNYLMFAVARLLARHWPEWEPRPGPGRLALTHDVDVLDKRWITRLKEGGFRAFNALRALKEGRYQTAWRTGMETTTFVLRRCNYFHLQPMAAMEAEYGFRSAFNVYAGEKPQGWLAQARSLVFDPTYDPAGDARLVETLRGLHANGWEIGLHPGFDTWADGKAMAGEKHALEHKLGIHRVTSVRQHWFRFSLEQTWLAQQQAGLTVDTTMGFTDRPGFRAGLTTPYRPYHHGRREALPLWVVPTILMDTHLYYYGMLDAQTRRERMDHLLGEVQRCGGTASIIWHSHVFSRDHGWQPEYAHLLKRMKEQGLGWALPGELADSFWPPGGALAGEGVDQAGKRRDEEHGSVGVARGAAGL